MIIIQISIKEIKIKNILLAKQILVSLLGEGGGALTLFGLIQNPFLTL